MDRGAWWAQSTGSQRVRHNRTTNTVLQARTPRMFDFCPRFSGPLVAGGALLWAHCPHSPSPSAQETPLLGCLWANTEQNPVPVCIQSALMKSQSLWGMFSPVCDGTHLSGVYTGLSQLHLPLTPQHCRNHRSFFHSLFLRKPIGSNDFSYQSTQNFLRSKSSSDLSLDTRLTFPALPGIFPSFPMDASVNVFKLNPQSLLPITFPSSQQSKTKASRWPMNTPFLSSFTSRWLSRPLPSTPHVSQLPLFYSHCIDQGPSTKQPTRMGLIEHRFIKMLFTHIHRLPLGNLGLKEPGRQRLLRHSKSCSCRRGPRTETVALDGIINL